MNIRIWGNYIENTMTMVSAASTSAGPLYIFRNVASVSRQCADFTSQYINTHGGYYYNYTIPSDEDPRGYFLKTGGRSNSGSPYYGDGKFYVYHNTVLQESLPPGSNQILPLGPGASVAGAGGVIKNGVTRNNIFLRYTSGNGSIIYSPPGASGNSFDYDLHNGGSTPCGQCTLGINSVKVGSIAEVRFNLNNIVRETTGVVTRGWFGVFSSSPAYNSAQTLPNFNDGYEGSAPERGAQEYGSAPMEFGVNAYLN